MAAASVDGAEASSFAVERLLAASCVRFELLAPTGGFDNGHPAFGVRGRGGKVAGRLDVLHKPGVWPEAPYQKEVKGDAYQTPTGVVDVSEMSQRLVVDVNVGRGKMLVVSGRLGMFDGEGEKVVLGIHMGVHDPRGIVVAGLVVVVAHDDKDNPDCCGRQNGGREAHGGRSAVGVEGVGLCLVHLPQIASCDSRHAPALALSPVLQVSAPRLTGMKK
ncbi:hypothetical protein HDV00_006916 [Rhizophlyctis rosea]|nr:hypothetical protein HDV00_006916 [Rhizophlyctis rosea]